MPTESSSIPAAWLPAAKSILLLEEKSDVDSPHSTVLAERGYRVVLTHTGADAFESWNQCRPDLVLLSFRQFDQGLFDFLEKIQLAMPTQRIAFLQQGDFSLAPVFRDDQLVRLAEHPEDYLKKVDALLGQK